jgi:metallo-beta-lactamase class B/metallo-beta-lactamase class B GIM
LKILATALVLLLLTPDLSADEQDGSLEIRQIAEGVYLHTSYMDLPGYGNYPSNGLIVINEGEAWLVDTTWSEQDMPELMTWIDGKGYTLAGSLTTHFHEDRSSGIGTLNAQGIATHASTLTNELLAETGSEAAVTAFTGVNFEFAGGVIEVFYPGPGHSKDNVVAWLPGSRILFGGCLVRSQSARGMGNTADADLLAWPDSVQKLVNRFTDVAIVVPGHGQPGGPELLSHTIRLADEARAQTVD